MVNIVTLKTMFMYVTRHFPRAKSNVLHMCRSLSPSQHAGISEVTYPHIRYISSRMTGFGRTYEVRTVCLLITSDCASISPSTNKAKKNVKNESALSLYSANTLTLGKHSCHSEGRRKGESKI